MKRSTRIWIAAAVVVVVMSLATAPVATAFPLDAHSAPLLTRVWTNVLVWLSWGEWGTGGAAKHGCDLDPDGCANS